MFQKNQQCLFLRVTMVSSQEEDWNGMIWIWMLIELQFWVGKIICRKNLSGDVHSDDCINLISTLFLGARGEVSANLIISIFSFFLLRLHLFKSNNFLISQTLLDQDLVGTTVILNPLIVTCKDLSSQQLTIYHILVDTCSVSHLKNVRVKLLTFHQMLQLLLHDLIFTFLQLLLLSKKYWTIIFLILKWRDRMQIVKYIFYCCSHLFTFPFFQ